MRRTTRCALLGGLLALLLGLLFLPLTKGPIDSALTSSAKAGLSGAGVSGVNVDSDWASLTLHGPAAAKDAALAAVAKMDHRNAVNQVTYVTDGAATSPTTPAATDGSVDATVKLDSGASPQTITLSGVVADEAQHAQLLNAATGQVGSSNVTDNLTVSGNTAAAEVGRAVSRLGVLIGTMHTAGVTGSMHLKNTELTIDGSTASAQDAANVNNALDAAAAAGVTVNGKVKTGGSTGTVQDQLKDFALQGITFKTGSATLTSQGQATLDKVAAVLTANPNVKVEIAGYTDNVGKAQSNLTLSTNRANAVREYLISRGIDGNRLTAKGYGQANPIADNNTAAGRQANRRIEFKIVGS